MYNPSQFLHTASTPMKTRSTKHMCQQHMQEGLQNEANHKSRHGGVRYALVKIPRLSLKSHKPTAWSFAYANEAGTTCACQANTYILCDRILCKFHRNQHTRSIANLEAHAKYAAHKKTPPTPTPHTNRSKINPQSDHAATQVRTSVLRGLINSPIKRPLGLR